MLVLSRTPWEKIKLYTSNGVIEMTITRIEGKVVKIGFDAPRCVRIVRSELEPEGVAELGIKLDEVV